MTKTKIEDIECPYCDGPLKEHDTINSDLANLLYLATGKEERVYGFFPDEEADKKVDKYHKRIRKSIGKRISKKDVISRIEYMMDSDAFMVMTHSEVERAIKLYDFFTKYFKITK